MKKATRAGIMIVVAVVIGLALCAIMLEPYAICRRALPGNAGR